MKKTTTLFLLALLAFMFNSCKDKEEDKGKNGKLVKTIELEVFKNEKVVQIVSYTYFYDNQNRLIGIKELYRENDDPFYYEFTHSFKYSPSTIIVNDKFYYLLDDNGYLIRSSEYDNGSLYYTDYIYENGYLKETRNESGELMGKYTWLNGNMVSAIGEFISMNGDTIVSTCTFEYSSKKNLLNINLPWDSGFDFLEGMLKFKGIANKNLLKKITHQESIELAVTDVQFDDKGYSTQIILNHYSPYPLVQEKQKYTITYY
jgi:hypothetical protein